MKNQNAARRAIQEKPAAKKWTPQDALAYALSQLEGTVKGYAESKAKFIEKLSSDRSASQVIHWEAEAIVAAEYEYSECFQLLSAWKNLSPVEQTPEKMLAFLKEMAASIAQALMGNRFRPTSTSPWSNAEEITKAETAARFYRRVTEWARDVEREIVEGA